MVGSNRKSMCSVLISLSVNCIIFLQVLGQLDKKFIACEITYTSSDPTLHKVSEIIVLFDQHAVHERVRLETLTEENYETLENGDRVIRTCMITPPLEMTLPESEVRLMMAYAKTFILWGLHFTQVFVMVIILSTSFNFFFFA